ncbi:hypothetical protein M9Y10_034218 [Tritrichomonas musculus]|uniref:Nuclear transport factor 2 domain-containing protein n=1 Tax=Tritrichomonas musculus TaxID=1915356 RepID=A0ABR2KF19_9EUKA
MTSEPSPDSLGIAKVIVDTFMRSIGSNNNEAINFFGDDGTLFFNGQTITGKSNILSFLDSLPKLSIRVTGYEVQTVPQSNLWSMVVIIGTSQIGDDNFKTFHSSAYVEARTSDHKAFIRYFSFASFD